MKGEIKLEATKTTTVTKGEEIKEREKIYPLRKNRNNHEDNDVESGWNKPEKLSFDLFHLISFLHTHSAIRIILLLEI